MPAPTKYSVELQQRATTMAMDARKDPESARGAIKLVADQLGVHPEALRNWVRQGEIDGRSQAWHHDAPHRGTASQAPPRTIEATDT